MMRGIVIATLLFLAAVPALCKEIIHLDLRTNKAGPKFSVALAAEKTRNEGELGHAFVIWYKEDARANASISTAAGFYPQTEQGKKDYSLLLQTSKGKVYDDSQSRRDLQLVVAVSEDKYKASQKVLERWKDPNKRYGLLLNDCVTFAQEVAKAIGLKAPARAFNPYPFEYLRALTEANIAKETTSFQQTSQNVLAATYSGPPLLQNLGPFIHSGVQQGPIVERCIYSWSDSHGFHSSHTVITFERQATKTTWKRFDHCMKLTVNGPIDANAIARSYIEKCVRDAINKDSNRHLFELLIAIGVDILAEGSTGFAATIAKSTAYANSVKDSAMECLTNTTRLEEHVAKDLRDSFGAKIEKVSNWVYWDL